MKTHIVALSGGKDSTAMALRLAEVEPRDYIYVCTPTGDELPEMFDHWKTLSGILGKPIVPVMEQSLDRLVRDQKAIPNWRMRFCTRMLKIAPFKAFLLKNLPAVSYVGLRADEGDREGATYGGNALLDSPDGVVQRYPLQEWGWGIGQVMGYLQQRGIEIPARTDCARCFFQRLGEWYLLWQQHPDIYADAERQEEEIGATWRSPGRDTWPAALKDLRARFEAGDVPKRSLAGMEKRKLMCRVCSL